MSKEKKLIMPNQDDQGNFYISYSQVKSWNAAKGFNTKLPGLWEYMRKYFFKEQYEDIGWNAFGNKVENALMTQDFKDFSKQEIATLKKVKVLPVWQQKIMIPLQGGIYLLGFIDNNTADFSHIRDYKTASSNSKEQYYSDDYEQVDIYAEGIRQITGKFPTKIDVVIIERKGNPYQKQPLTVGENVWIVDKQVNADRIGGIMENVNKTAQEIADHYEIFRELNKIA